MKKIYAAILLLSFMAGIIQPVIPMAEFHLKKADLFNILINQSTDQETIHNEQFCTHNPLSVSDDWKNNPQEMLIDTEFYPIPIKPDYFQSQTILPVRYKVYQIPEWSLTEIYLKKFTPPPRFFYHNAQAVK